jgi:hypothetical protein
VVSAANPRYFTIQAGDAADQRAVYLTCSHSVDSRETVGADTLTFEEPSTISLRAPFEASGSAVVYLKQVGL